MSDDDRWNYEAIFDRLDAPIKERVLACVNACRGVPTSELTTFRKTIDECKLPYASIAWCKFMLEHSGFEVREKQQ